MKDEIKKFWRGDIDDADETLTKYSHDASLFEIRPEIVLYPKDAKDIENLVLWAKEKKEENKQGHENLSITVRSAGTCMSGGAINDSIILDVTKYFNKIGRVVRVTPYKILPKFPGAKEVEIAGEVTVQPGVFYRDFEKETFMYDLLLPSYTASKSINTVGGMAGNNSAGELTLKYGQTCDYIKEMKVIFADGHEYTVKALNRKELYKKIAQPDFEGQVYKKLFDLINENETIIKTAKPRVSKNSSGYFLWNVITRGKTESEDIFDLCQLIVGSQGTLGIVTEITYRLVENITHSKLVTVFLKDLTNLGKVVDEILEFSPTSVESYDDKTFDLAMKFFPDLVKAKGFWQTIKFGISFLPEMWMVLTGGVPKLILLVELTGSDDKTLVKKCKELEQKIAHFGFVTRTIEKQKEAEKYWTMRRDSFALLRKHVEGRRTAPFIDDIIVRPEFLPEFLPKLTKILNEYSSLIYTIAGHAGNGNFHIIPLMDFNDKESAHIVLELSQKVYDLVISYDGSITGEHNDGLIRTPFLTKLYGEQIVELFKKTKDMFDPLNIFNPKKKVGAVFSDIEKYIIKPQNVHELPKISHNS